jgi:DNA-binding response OmpR family regulator
MIAAKESAARVAIAASLIKRRCQIVCVKDGNTAQGALAAGGIDICIIDDALPTTTGRQLCMWIQSAALEPTPLVILLTSRNGTDDCASGWGCANEYFWKPVDAEQLGLRVRLLANRLNMGSRIQ